MLFSGFGPSFTAALSECLAAACDVIGAKRYTSLLCTMLHQQLWRQRSQQQQQQQQQHQQHLESSERTAAVAMYALSAAGPARFSCTGARHSSGGGGGDGHRNSDEGRGDDGPEEREEDGALSRNTGSQQVADCAPLLAELMFELYGIVESACIRQHDWELWVQQQQPMPPPPPPPHLRAVCYRQPPLFLPFCSAVAATGREFAAHMMGPGAGISAMAEEGPEFIAQMLQLILQGDPRGGGGHGQSRREGGGEGPEFIAQMLQLILQGEPGG